MSHDVFHRLSTPTPPTSPTSENPTFFLANLPLSIVNPAAKLTDMNHDRDRPRRTHGDDEGNTLPISLQTIDEGKVHESVSPLTSEGNATLTSKWTDIDEQTDQTSTLPSSQF